jgi:hypothetical protein
MKGKKYNDICAEKLITWDLTWPGDIMHLLVIMKTMSVTIDRQVLISSVFVLVSSIVSSVFGQRCHSQAWLIGRCLRWSLRSLAYAGAAFP